jgi:transposase
LLSAIAGITWWRFYVRLFPGPIKGPQVVEFLSHLQRHLRGKLLVIWDGLPAHRSRVVQAYVRAQRGRLTLEVLPAYAPELNPVEYIWGYWKHHELPNLCPKSFGELSHHARAALRRMRRRPTLVAAFWQQAELFAESQYYAILNRLTLPSSIDFPRSASPYTLVMGSTMGGRVISWSKRAADSIVATNGGRHDRGWVSGRDRGKGRENRQIARVPVTMWPP